MTEHNLPEKDDAPWLHTTYDGFNEAHHSLFGNRKLIQLSLTYNYSSPIISNNSLDEN